MLTQLIISLFGLTPTPTPPIYHLAFQGTGCTYSAQLNDYPVAAKDTSDHFGQPVNLLLVGSGNRLVVTTEGTRCALNVSVNQIHRQAGTSKSLVSAKLTGVATQTYTFDSQIKPLTRWLATTPFRDDAGLRQFAIDLMALAIKPDQAKFKPLFTTKALEYHQAYGLPLPDLMQSMFRTLSELGSAKPLTVADIELDPILGGRLWRLRARGQSAAFFSVKVDDELRQLSVVVGRVDGKWVVVH